MDKIKQNSHRSDTQTDGKTDASGLANAKINSVVPLRTSDDSENDSPTSQNDMRKHSTVSPLHRSPIESFKQFFRKRKQSTTDEHTNPSQVRRKTIGENIGLMKQVFAFTFSCVEFLIDFLTE